MTTIIRVFYSWQPLFKIFGEEMETGNPCTTEKHSKQITAIDNEEAKVKRLIKQVAKKGDVKIWNMLAKELIRSQRHKNRLYTSKAQLNSIIMQLTSTSHY
ncbi:unnamed protein product [Rhizopus microsporus]